MHRVVARQVGAVRRDQAASLGTGLACGAAVAGAAVSAGPAGAAVAGGLCAGFVGGTLGALEAGEGLSSAIGYGMFGMFAGALAGGVGYATGTLALHGTDSYYGFVYGRVAGSTGASLGVQAAMGGEVNWASLSVQFGLAAVMGVVEAGQLKQAAATRGASAWLAARASSLAVHDPGSGAASAPIMDFKEVTSDGRIRAALRGLRGTPGGGGQLKYFQEPQGANFATEKMAAYFATRRALALTTLYGVEYGAAIVPQGNGFGISTYVTSGQHGTIDGFMARLFSVGVNVESGGFSSFTHGHPIGAWINGEYFRTEQWASQAGYPSPGDIKFARAVQAPLYVGAPNGQWFGVTPSGQVNPLGSLGISDPWYGN